MVSYTGREQRKVKLQKVIEENFEEGEWFTVHDISYLWNKRWSHSLTVRELAKILPMMGLESEKRDGYNYKFYKYNGKKPLYVKQPRPVFDDDDKK